MRYCYAARHDVIPDSTAAMKQGLHLQLGQQLKMTPQLQQAIRLLQLSALDLRQEIQDTVESNPLLELEDETDSFGDDAERPDSAE